MTALPIKPVLERFPDPPTVNYKASPAGAQKAGLLRSASRQDLRPPRKDALLFLELAQGCID